MLKKLMEAAISEGLTLYCIYPGEESVDYVGKDVSKAYEAMCACDEMILEVRDDKKNLQGWCLYIPSLDEDEQIADTDYAGFVANFLG